MLPFRRSGTGKPLVLVHGYLGGSAQWDSQFDCLAQTHDVIAPDLPGFGQASGQTGCDRIEDFANAVVACLDAQGIDRFNLLGHSMGGMIVQDIAARFGGRIDALVLYGTGPLGLMPDRFESIDTSIARLQADGVHATADRISATWFRNGQDAPGYAATRDIARRANPVAARKALVAMRDWDGRSALPSMDMRTCVLWGDQDRSYKWPQVHALWAGIPAAELAVIAGASHAVHMEKPVIFNHMVQDFLVAAGA